MSEITNILQEINSSGVYRVVRDVSQTFANTTTPLRVLIGSSRKGKFNSLVKFNDFNEFKFVHGNIDRKLERRGSYFHRMAREMLKAAPIYAINLRAFDDTMDTLSKVSISVKSEEVNSSIIQTALTNIYSTDGFWRIDEDIIGENADQLLNFSSISESNSTVFVIKTPTNSNETRGLRIPVSEWYSTEQDDKPEYLNDKKLVSDYLITAYVFAGDLTDYASLSTDAVLGNYFDLNGLKRTFVDQNGLTINTLEALRNIPESKFIGKYTGSLIQGFLDKNENVLDFQSVFNASQDSHGLICSLSQSFYDDYDPMTDKPLIDLEGEGIFSDTPVTSFNFLSYDIDTVPTGSVIMTYDALNGNLTNDVVKDDSLNPKDPTLIKLTKLVSQATDNFSFEVHNMYPIQIGDLFEAIDGGFARVTKIDVTVAANGTIPVDTLRVYLDRPAVITDNAGVLEIYRFIPVQEQPEPYKGFYLQGYTVRDEQLPDGTLSRQKEIFSILDDVGLRSQLTDSKRLKFRYIVDSYETYIDSGIKSQLSRLAGENGNIRVISSMPSMKTFKKSTNPYFKRTPTSNVDLGRYLETGGNLDLNPTLRLSMPDTLNTPNNIYFYGGHFEIYDKGRTIYMPMNANISNLYLNNFDVNKPYTPIAGTSNGRVPLPENFVDIEHEFTLDERKAMESFGFNPIINLERFGLIINNQLTAQQRVQSSLSYIHVNEMVKELGIEIDNVLEPYRNNSFNVANTRSLIVSEIDSILKTYQQGQGLSYYEVTMDESNNTQEVFDNQAGIINVRISPNANLAKLITIFQIDRFNLTSFEV